MKRVALYVRVSTQEQKNKGLSVDSQIDALRDYCKEKSYIEAGLYNDAGISARKSYKKRPALLQLMDDCRAGKIDLIIFTKLDRWFRSVADYYQVQTVLDSCRVPWRAIWEDYETETSSGVFKVNIMLSVAQSEADRTSERIKSVNDWKRSTGKYVGGKAPTGYRIEKDQLLIDESTHDIVAGMFDLYANTMSIAEAVRFAHSNGLMIVRDTFVRMLHNPTYYGRTQYGYICEPYITREQFEINLASVVGRRNREPVKKDGVFIFQGILKCAECGGNFSGNCRAYSVKKGTTYCRYYRCIKHRNMGCPNQRTITESKLEAYLLDVMDEEMRKYSLSFTPSRQKKSNQKKIDELEARLARVGDRYEDGDLSRDDYKKKRAELVAQIDELRSAVESPKKPVKLPKDWKEIYNSLDSVHKRAFWRSTVREIRQPRDVSQPVEIVFF